MARQSSTGNMPMDIDTPDGSVFGDYDDIIASSGTQYEYPWPEKVQQNIEEYKMWMNNELERVKNFQYNGPSGKPWPKKPRVDFKKLDETSRNGTKELCGEELHSYLVENCPTSDQVVEWPETPAGGFSSLENMKEPLKGGWEALKQHNQKTLGYYLKYGKLLNAAFAQHELEKDNGKTDSTWEEWLTENVGISTPQGRKIREVARLLAPYPGFKRLGLSFSEVYNRRKQIAVLLAAPNQQWGNYWRVD